MASTTEIKVPSLGESISEATIAQWVKHKGDFVKEDETILELETDKVTLEVNAPCDGTLIELKVKEGDTVEVGDLVALLAQGHVDVDSTSSNESSKEAAPDSKSEDSSNSQPSAKQEPESQQQPQPQNSGGKANTSGPAAQKIAQEKGIDINTLQGSGKDGRVTKGDALQASAPKAPTPKEASDQVPHIDINVPKESRAHVNTTDSAPREERVKMTRLRKTIASRLKEAQNTAAMLTTFNEVDMTAVMEARKLYKDNFEKRHGVKLGFMSFFVKAAITALKEIPAVNAEIDGDDLVYKNHYDIGVAVSTPNGLVVPVVKDADKIGFADVEKTIGDLGRRARDGKLSMQELQGGTFTITNGGIFGSLMSTPILNPPQSAILGMHKIQERPMVINGEIKVRPMMYLALSYDHRIVDGREAVTFLVRIKECIENPERILLDI